MEFLANVFVQRWDQHVGYDGAAAIVLALKRAGLALKKENVDGR
jgi:hypothetical protein